MIIIDYMVWCCQQHVVKWTKQQPISGKWTGIRDADPAKPRAKHLSTSRSTLRGQDWHHELNIPKNLPLKRGWFLPPRCTNELIIWHNSHENHATTVESCYDSVSQLARVEGLKNDFRIFLGLIFTHTYMCIYTMLPYIVLESEVITEDSSVHDLSRRSSPESF